jgi:hypothetical protein
MLFFMLIGLAFIIIPLLLKRRKLNRCSEKLMATCVKLDSHISTDSDGSSTRVYCPTWRFYFGGLEYNVKEKGYSNINVPKKGEERELYVNPENPREIYRKNPFVTAILVIMGAIFFLIGFLTVTFNFVFSFVS